jgi:putative endonuclease
VTSREAGRRAEALAAELLERAGMRILARNWRQPEGDQAEIDLVADDAGICVFVEVRARTGEEHGHPLEAVGGRKRAQVIRAARLYLASDALASSPTGGFRFDVVGVLFPTDGGEAQLFHVPNAFEVESW